MSITDNYVVNLPLFYETDQLNHLLGFNSIVSTPSRKIVFFQWDYLVWIHQDFVNTVKSKNRFLFEAWSN